MFILGMVLLGFLGLRWGITMLNVLGRPFLTHQTSSSDATVSILVPVRNEANNLPTLFKQLSSLNAHQMEIIFLNDHSEDESEELLKGFSSAHTHVRYVNGSPLPEGWLGKHWACHQLAKEANGSYLLFLDADIAFLHPSLISSSKACMEKYQLKLLSLFPDQIMESRGEQWTVPIMHYLLLSLLPLWWILRLPFPSMAAANGQFMFFEADAYRRFLWHERVKDNVVEDIAIMQQLKEEKLKGLTLLGNGLIKCRMYKSLGEGIEGFSKNILAGFGNSPIGLGIYLFLIMLGWVLVIPFLPLSLLLLSLFLMLSIRAGISYLAKQPLWVNLVYHPIQMGLLVYISLLSIYKKSTKQVVWKGRNIAGK
ncbi:MAG: glycosyltransferase family 2 protein [Bacteroidota bacterium]